MPSVGAGFPRCWCHREVEVARRAWAVAGAATLQ